MPAINVLASLSFLSLLGMMAAKEEWRITTGLEPGRGKRQEASSGIGSGAVDSVQLNPL